MTLENELSESGRELYHSRLITKKVEAGQAILEAAGGVVTTEDGAPFTYGKLERGLDPYSGKSLG